MASLGVVVQVHVVAYTLRYDL